MSVGSLEPEPETGEPAAEPRAAEEGQPLAVAVGLVSLGAEDAPTCSDGICW